MTGVGTFLSLAYNPGRIYNRTGYLVQMPDHFDDIFSSIRRYCSQRDSRAVFPSTAVARHHLLAQRGYDVESRRLFGAPEFSGSRR